MKHKKKRDTLGIPGDRYAGTRILGVQGVGTSRLLENSSKTPKDLNHSLYRRSAGAPIGRQNNLQQTDRQQPSLCLLHPGVLRQWRDALGWTQKCMAAAITKHLPPDLDTFDLETYQAWERGKARPSKPEAHAVEQILQEHSNPRDEGGSVPPAHTDLHRLHSELSSIVWSAHHWATCRQDCRTYGRRYGKEVR